MSLRTQGPTLSVSLQDLKVERREGPRWFPFCLPHAPLSLVSASLYVSAPFFSPVLLSVYLQPCFQYSVLPRHLTWSHNKDNLSFLVRVSSAPAPRTP